VIWIECCSTRSCELLTHDTLSLLTTWGFNKHWWNKCADIFSYVYIIRVGYSGNSSNLNPRGDRFEYRRSWLSFTRFHSVPSGIMKSHSSSFAMLTGSNIGYISWDSGRFSWGGKPLRIRELTVCESYNSEVGWTEPQAKLLIHQVAVNFRVRSVTARIT
jgi:hypothetical protein